MAEDELRAQILELQSRIAVLEQRLDGGEGGIGIDNFAPPIPQAGADPHPFQVEWDPAENSGSGGWVMYLPSTTKALYHQGDYITITGLTASSSSGTGWYKFSSSTGNVWLVVTFPETGAPTAAIQGTDATASDGQKVQNILIAQTTSSGQVMQHVTSAIIAMDVYYK